MVYSCSFNNSDNDAGTISYTCTIGKKGTLSDYGSNVTVQGWYNNQWNDIATLNYGRDNQNKDRSHTLTGDAQKLTEVRFITTSKTTLKYDYSVSNFKIKRETSLSVSPTSITMDDTPVGTNSTKTFTITYHNSDQPQTFSVSESGDANNFFSVNATSTQVKDCKNSVTYTVTFAPTSVVTNATARYTISGNGATAVAVDVTGTSLPVVDPTFTSTLAESYEVDQKAIDLSTLLTSNNKNAAISYEKVSFTVSGKNNTGGQDPYIDTDGKTLHLGRAGEFTVKMSQVASAGYNAKNVTYTVKIVKRQNALTCSLGNSWSYNIGFDTEQAVTFTPTNKDNGAPAVTVTNKSGNNVVTYTATNTTGAGKFNTNYRKDKAVFEVKQEENYKYIEASANCTINVAPATSSCPILLHSSDPDTEASKVGPIDFGYYGASMTFDVKANGLGPTTIVTKYYSDNSTSEESASGTVNLLGASYEGKSMDLGANSSGAYVTKVKFGKGGITSTDDPYINAIRIYATKYLETKNTDGAVISNLTTPLNVKGGHQKTFKFKLEYATCDDRIKLVSSSNKLKFANGQTTYWFTPSSNKYGRQDIELTFTSANAAETVNETITIYTQYEYKTLTVTCQTVDY